MPNLCTRCHSKLRLYSQGTWAKLFGSQLVIVPDISVFVCDRCDEIEFDSELLGQVEILLRSSLQSSNRRTKGVASEISQQLPEINTRLHGAK